jgi:uncharacterized protein YggE
MVVIPQSYAQSSFENILSSSYPVTITVTGQSSEMVRADQVTMSLDIQSQWGNSSSVISSQKDNVQKIIDQIKSVSPMSQISIGETTINPFYPNGRTSSTYQAYSSVHVTANLTSFDYMSSKLGEQKIAIQDSTITEIPLGHVSKGNITKISINAGSATSPACASDNTCFTPSKITVSTGTKVVWENNDKISHTITSGTPAADYSGTMFDSALMKPSSTFSYTFLNPGNFDYYCQVHPWMTGMVVVTGNSMTSGNQTQYQASLNIPISTTPDTFYDTVKKFHSQVSTIKEILKSGGISDNDISVDPLRINQVFSGQQASSAYNSDTNIVITTSVGDLSKVTDVANNAGVGMGRITMTISQKTLDSAKKELSQQALDDALAQAHQIADGAGLTIKSIQDIQLSPPVVSHDIPVRYNGPVAVVPDFYSSGQLAVTATVKFVVGK